MDNIAAGRKKKSDVTRIFWPEHCNNREGGHIVGWNLHSFTACVATVVKNVHLKQLNNALEVISTCPRYSHLFSDCGGIPGLLGEYKGARKSRPTSVAIQQMRQSANFWLTLDGRNGYPSLRDIHCCGFRYSVFSVTAQFIIYKQPVGMTYYSTIPFSLYPQPGSSQTPSEFEMGLQQVNNSCLVESVLNEVLSRMRAGSKPGTVILQGVAHEPPLVLTGFGTTLHEESDSDAGERGGQDGADEGGVGSDGSSDGIKNRSVGLGDGDGGGSWNGGQNTLHAGGGGGGHSTVEVACLHVVLFILMFLHACALLLSRILEIKVLRLGPILGAPAPPTPGGSSRRPGERWRGLKFASATGRQLQRRIDQMSTSPIFSPSAWTQLQHGAGTAQSRAITVKFNTSVCMVGLDLFLGLIFCSYLLNNHRAVLRWLDEASLLHTQLLLQAVRWIMGVPAGLKLNDSLDYCLGNLCILGIQCYQVMYTLCLPLFPWALVAVSASGVFGATVTMSVVSDLLSLTTMHIFISYALAARWHGLQTRVLSSLWRLFRGKKRNVLRGRIDSCDYSLDQLLLGTLLFTLLVFLFPTTFVYYLLFFLAYTAIGAVQACIDIFVWVLNHFPLFSVANCLWNPSHHPGGICLQLLATGSAISKPPDVLQSTVSSGSLRASQSSVGVWNDRVSASGLKHSISLPDMSHALPGGGGNDATAIVVPATKSIARPSQPSPLRANERRKASLWGRSSYYRLLNRPLAIPSLFDHYMSRLGKVTAQQSPNRLLRCMLLAEALPAYVLDKEEEPGLLPLLDAWLFFKLDLFGLAAAD